ncbi:MAG: phosphoribosyltransferase [Acidimicrobiales bacterium]
MPTASFDWSQLSRDSRHDRRGARLEWAVIRVRTENSVPEMAVVFRCPSWVESQVKPYMKSRGMQEIRLTKDWDLGFLLPTSGLDDEAQQVLALLSEICSLNGFGTVDICLALDLYKVPDEDVPPERWPNTYAGEMVSRSKYWIPPEGPAAFRRLTGDLSTVVSVHPQLREAECIVSIPGGSSTTRGHGERLAQAVAETTSKTFVRTQPLYGERPQAKEGGFRLTEELVAIPAHFGGSSVIVVDDVLRSGTSMSAIASKVRAAGGGSVYGLVGAKTLRN